MNIPELTLFPYDLKKKEYQYRDYKPELTDFRTVLQKEVFHCAEKIVYVNREGMTFVLKSPKTQTRNPTKEIKRWYNRSKTQAELN